MTASPPPANALREHVHEWSVVGRPFCLVDGCGALGYVISEETWKHLAAAPAPGLDGLTEDRFAAVLHGWEHGDSTPMDRCRHGHILDARYLLTRLAGGAE